MQAVHTPDNLFELAFRHAADGMSLLRDGRFIDCNDVAVKMMGAVSRDEIIGRTPFDFSPESQHDGISSEIRGAEVLKQCAENGIAQFEWLHQRLDGELFWSETIITRIPPEDENILLVNWRDISAKKALELKLAEKSQTFETLFRESIDSLSLLHDYKLYDCNKAFLDMFGYRSKSDVIGLSPLDISPEFQENGEASIDVITANAKQLDEEGMKRQEWQYKKADGTVFWAEIIVSDIVLNGEKVAYVTSRDISEKKALEKEVNARNAELNLSNKHLSESLESLKLAQKKLIESEKMASLGMLVAGVAHEINTPVGISLTAVTQFMEESRDIRTRYSDGTITEEDFEDFLETSSEVAEILKKNIVRTAQLVRSFKQVAVDQTSEQDRTINLAAYIQEILFSLASVLRKSHVEVAVDCADDFNVTTNPGLFSQVLTNLIMNSVNHGFSAADSGHIAISVTAEDTLFTLIYRDNGKGISKQNLGKIFDPFFTTNRQGGGTGLGLNIIYNIVTSALGGSITCDSEEGKGVTFTLTFSVKARA